MEVYTMKKAAVYLRVSTNDQTTENQRLAIESYCKVQGWEISKVYDDSGISGAKDDRPALNQLKKDCIKNSFDIVIVHRFDRMARSTSHLLECLNLFQRYGIEFVSVSEAIDTSTSVGRMVYSFLGAIAEFERNLIRERVNAGIKRAKQSGVHCGRPRKGYDLGEAIKLHNQGLGLRTIASKLGVSYATIHRGLKSVTKACQTA